MSYSEQLIEFITKGCILCKNPTNNIITLEGLDPGIFNKLRVECIPFIINDELNTFTVRYLGNKIVLRK